MNRVHEDRADVRYLPFVAVYMFWCCIPDDVEPVVNDEDIAATTIVAKSSGVLPGLHRLKLLKLVYGMTAV